MGIQEMTLGELTAMLKAKQLTLTLLRKDGQYLVALERDGHLTAADGISVIVQRPELLDAIDAAWAEAMAKDNAIESDKERLARLDKAIANFEKS